MYGYVVVTGEREETELLGMGYGKALVEHLVGDGEDGGVGSDGEGEGADGDGGKAGALAEDTGGVAEVAPEVVCPAKAERGAHAVFVGCDGAEFETGLTLCFFGGEAGADEVGGAGVDVELDFGLHVFFEASAVEGRAQPGFEAGDHDWTSVNSRMVPMIPAMRFHFSVSAASCLRPAGVSE